MAEPEAIIYHETHLLLGFIQIRHVVCHCGVALLRVPQGTALRKTKCAISPVCYLLTHFNYIDLSYIFHFQSYKMCFFRQSLLVSCFDLQNNGNLWILFETTQTRIRYGGSVYIPQRTTLSRPSRPKKISLDSPHWRLVGH